MSSVFTTIADKKIKSFLGVEHSIPFFMQFVPGVVKEVITSKSARNVEYTNTIIAKPHITDNSFDGESIFGNQGNYTEDRRYYPLFRGFVDVPTIGDPVLLCTIADTNYYLGPLNTDSNNPTFNVDNYTVPKADALQTNITLNMPHKKRLDKDGSSINFDNKDPHNRLIKRQIIELDHPKNVFLNPDAKENHQIDLQKRNKDDIHGDMIFEGRHGNSVRIGSRDIHTYLYLIIGVTLINMNL